MAYKRDIDDVRESPGLDILHLLMGMGAKVSYSDAYIPSLKIDGETLTSKDMLQASAEADCVVVVTDHSHVDYAKVIEVSTLIVDTRNALKKHSSPKIVKL
jgi:UDP-N-acetyl-D-glucosamine dehydrogenase